VTDDEAAQEYTLTEEDMRLALQRCAVTYMAYTWTSKDERVKAKRVVIVSMN